MKADYEKWEIGKSYKRRDEKIADFIYKSEIRSSKYIYLFVHDTREGYENFHWHREDGKCGCDDHPFDIKGEL